MGKTYLTMSKDYVRPKRSPNGVRVVRTKICELCKNEFVANFSNYHRARFCSRSCSSKSHPSGRLGKKGSEKQRQVMRNRKGEKHHRWLKDRDEAMERHRVRNLLEVKNWRKQIFIRDDYSCQECSVRGCNLEAHHILKWKEYPALRYEMYNGVTLCRKCHLKTLGKENLFEIKYFTFLILKHDYNIPLLRERYNLP